jgi:prophage regulatory protein
MKILRIKKLKDVTGLSKTTIYYLISKEQFPPPIRLTPGTVGWLESDVFDWINNCKTKSENEVW